MRRTLAALLMALLLAPELPARSNGDWDNVKKLKRGAYIEISLWSGENLSGRIEDVNNTGLQVATAERSGGGPGAGWLRDVDRASIRTVVRFRRPYVPDGKRWMATGAVGGGLIGVTAGAVADAEHGNHARWLLGGLGGAGLGLLVSCAALAAVGAFDTAQEMHRRDIVYEAKRARPPQP
jgi:hypothetical protein